MANSGIRFFTKSLLGDTSFTREHMDGTIRAYRQRGKDTRWKFVFVIFEGKIYHAPGAYRRIRDVENWAVGKLRELRGAS